MNAQSPRLSKAELLMIDAYWRAANYLSVGQIYLYDNPIALVIGWKALAGRRTPTLAS